MSAATTPNPYVARLERLEQLVGEQASRIERLERTLAAIGAAFGGGGADAASDRELDHPQHGDPEVRVVPRDWTEGGVVKGQKFSRCPADFLDLLAETYTFFAERNDAKGEKDGRGNPKSMWDRKNARLARGWARRLRAGWTPPPVPPAPSFGGTGSGFGAPRSWGAPSGGFGSNGGLPARPQAPAETPSAPAQDDDSFDFGANVGRAPATTTTTADDDFDEEEPLL